MFDRNKKLEENIDNENKYNLQKVKDFGNAVITPGFVNLLTHLPKSP